MRLFTLTCFIAFCTALFGQQSTGTSDEPAPALAGDAGFKEALFDSTTLEALLKDGAVVAIRFYNVLARAGDANGTAMAIGIHTDGTEANKGKSYRMSLGLVKGKVQISNLSVEKAAIACQDMDNPAHRSYSASFTRTEVEALLALDGCQALQATPGTAKSGETTMVLTAMKIVGDKAEALGQGPEFDKLCGYPCPTVCGPEKNYVYRTKY